MAVLRLAALGLILAACAGSPAESPGRGLNGPPVAEIGDCADVIAAELVPAVDGTFRVSATVSSPDTGWEKYADEWRVLAPSGEVLGIRELSHPHVGEQPFTRSLSGVEIPPGIDEVTLEARDSVEGYCGESTTVTVP